MRPRFKCSGKGNGGMMPDVNASTAAAATAAGMITVTGGVLGMQYDVLLAGFFGGIVALSFADRQSHLKMAMSVFSSSLLAGYFAPIAAALAAHYMPALTASGESLRLACACAIGLAAQTAIPAGLAWLRERISRDAAKGGTQ